MNSLQVMQDCALYQGPLLQNSMHAHHALQFTWCTDRPFSLELSGNTIQCQAALIGQNVPHSIYCDSSQVNVLLFEPIFESEFRPHTAMPDIQVCDEHVPFINKLNLSGPDARSIVSYVTEMLDLVKIDSRVVDIIGHIKSEENCRHELSYFSRHYSLSEGRLSHLFKEHSGISMKKYLLFQRLLFVIDSLRSGASLTDISLDCGFSDLSHLSRTFRMFFGFSPSEIFGNSSSVQVEFGD